MADERQELLSQLSVLEQETRDIKQMSLSIDQLQEKLDANAIARKRLRKKLLDLGYNI